MADLFNPFNGVPATPLVYIPDDDDEHDIKVRVPVVPIQVNNPKVNVPIQDNRPERVPRRANNRHVVRDDPDDEWMREAHPVNLHRGPVGLPAFNVPQLGGNIAAMNEVEKTECFWKMITQFEWRNRSDGIINARTIQNIMARQTPLQRDLFKEMYNRHFDMMRERLELDDMFERNGINRLDDRAKVVSHAIAMGQEQFNTLLDDPAFFQFFIETGECQSLDCHLPADMQH